jgi:hypothetical protein
MNKQVCALVIKCRRPYLAASGGGVLRNRAVQAACVGSQQCERLTSPTSPCRHCAESNVGFLELSRQARVAMQAGSRF